MSMWDTKFRSANVEALLTQESTAFAQEDLSNIASFFVIRKTHSKMATIKRSRYVMMVLSDLGMPSVMLITPAILFSAWDKLRGKTPEEISYETCI